MEPVARVPVQLRRTLHRGGAPPCADAGRRDRKRGSLGETQERLGLTYLFIAHDLAVVGQLCQRVAVMYLGKIVGIGARDHVYRRPLHPYTRALFSADPSRIRPSSVSGGGSSCVGTSPARSTRRARR